MNAKYAEISKDVVASLDRSEFSQFKLYIRDGPKVS